MSDLKDPRHPKGKLREAGRPIALTLSDPYEPYCQQHIVRYNLLVGRAMFIEKVTHNFDVVSIPNSYATDDLALRCYIEYLHYGIINSKIGQSSYSCYKEYILLSKAYIIGINVEDVEFRNLVMNALLCNFQDIDDDASIRHLDEEVIMDVYERTEVGSPLRRFLVDSFIWAGTEESLDIASESVPKQFLWELSTALMRAHAQNRPDLRIPGNVSCCDYHEHQEGEGCKNRKQNPSEANETMDDAEFDSEETSDSEETIDSD